MKKYKKGDRVYLKSKNRLVIGVIDKRVVLPKQIFYEVIIYPNPYAKEKFRVLVKPKDIIKR